MSSLRSTRTGWTLATALRRSTSGNKTSDAASSDQALLLQADGKRKALALKPSGPMQLLPAGGGVVMPNTPPIRKCHWTACAEACQPLVSAAEADPSVSSEFRQ